VAGLRAVETFKRDGSAGRVEMVLDGSIAKKGRKASFVGGEIGKAGDDTGGGGAGKKPQ